MRANFGVIAFDILVRMVCSLLNNLPDWLSEARSERRRQEWKERRRRKKLETMQTARAGTEEVICLDPSNVEEPRPMIRVRRMEELISSSGPPDSVVTISSDEEPDSPSLLKHSSSRLELDDAPHPPVPQPPDLLADTCDMIASVVPNSKGENSVAKSRIPFRIRTTAELTSADPIVPSDGVPPTPTALASSFQEPLPANGVDLCNSATATMKSNTGTGFPEPNQRKPKKRRIDVQAPSLKPSGDEANIESIGQADGSRHSAIMQRYLEISSSRVPQSISTTHPPTQSGEPAYTKSAPQDSTQPPLQHPTTCKTFSQLQDHWRNIELPLGLRTFCPPSTTRAPENMSQGNPTKQRINAPPNYQKGFVTDPAFSPRSGQKEITIGEQLRRVNEILHIFKKMYKTSRFKTFQMVPEKLRDPVPIVLDLPSLNYFTTTPIPYPDHPDFNTYRKHMRSLLSLLHGKLKQEKKQKRLANIRNARDWGGKTDAVCCDDGSRLPNTHGMAGSNLLANNVGNSSYEQPGRVGMFGSGNAPNGSLLGSLQSSIGRGPSACVGGSYGRYDKTSVFGTDDGSRLGDASPGPGSLNDSRVTGQVSVFAPEGVMPGSRGETVSRAPPELRNPEPKTPTSGAKNDNPDRAPKLPWTALSNTSWDALYR